MLEIRTLTQTEIEMVIDWAAEEGWNPGLHDSAPFQLADPQGFLGGFLNDTLITAISAVNYGSNFGFIGLFITRPEFRGQGYGRAIWNEAMSRLSECAVGLDGVEEQQANYQRKGFELSYRTTRYSGTLSQIHDTSQSIVPVQESMFDSIADFDRLHFPADRTGFLEQWIAVSHNCYAHIRDGEIQGFGVVRVCRDGYKIGPLFATSLESATALVSALGSGCEGSIHIDIPDYQEAFVSALKSVGFIPGFTTARMYRGAAPSFRHEGVYAVTSLELG